MPAMSVVAFPVIIAHAGQNGASLYVVSPEDCTVVPDAVPSGGLTIRLPGANSPVPPGDGDFYMVSDANGLVGASNHLIIDGDGFTINGASTLTLAVANCWAAFQFIAEFGVWATFVGNIA